MLRISIKSENENERFLYLEGKISQQWVKELQSEIEKSLRKRKKTILDFSMVSYLDEVAAMMLNQFPDHKVEKRNCSLLIRTLLGLDE